eukprot:233539-Amphidinium_carterae.2
MQALTSRHKPCRAPSNYETACLVGVPASAIDGTPAVKFVSVVRRQCTCNGLPRRRFAKRRATVCKANTVG